MSALPAGLPDEPFPPGLGAATGADGPRVMAAVVRWLREASTRPWSDGEPPRTYRLRRALSALSHDPARAATREALGALRGRASAVRLLAETGLPDHPSLWKEAFRRASDRFLPRAEGTDDLYALLSRLPVTEADAEWVATLPRDVVAALGDLLAPTPDALYAAARLVALRAAGVGLSRDLLELTPGRPDAESPFFELHFRLRALSLSPDDEGAAIAFDTVLAACREELSRALGHLDERGVDTDLLYRVELLEAQLDRVGKLVALGRGGGDGPAFAAELLRGVVAQRSLRALVGSVFKRLARKVVEHTSETGEHYVVRDRKEWRETGNAGAGGGILTTFTAAAKHGLHALPLAPAVEGLAYSLNYAASFVVMQLGHLALASKQPAMTASALAAAVEKGGDDRRAVELSAGIFRSQAAATLGNVLVGLPFAVFLDLLVRLATGRPMLGAETAAETLAGLHPWRSFTVLFAALTGVLLWAGSLVAGWAANWSAYRRLPEAVATSPELVRLFGAGRAEAIGEFLRRHFGSLSGNVALGVLLGFTPSFLKFFGIPFEVRHVTLSACSTGLSLGSQWGHGAIDAGAVLTAVLGVAVIGVLNISVSFLLALWTAARARGLGADSWRTLKADVFRAFRREPGRFLLPPAGAGASPA